MSESDIGTRMKFYENLVAGQKLCKLLPIIARLDGRSFHGFCQGLNKPYDLNLQNLMIECSKYLIQETNACCAYTFSDEITLAWYSTEFDSEIFFDGRIAKMNSILASILSVYFNKNLSKFIPSHANKSPIFDCRVWTVPNIIEGSNAILWREQDATKNSVSMAARAYFSHNEVADKNGSEMQEMLWQKYRINWNDYPNSCKRGTYIQRKKITKKLSVEDLNSLPPLHNARKNPDLEIERTEYAILDLPPLSKVINRAEVIFFRAEPILNTFNTSG